MWRVRRWLRLWYRWLDWFLDLPAEVEKKVWQEVMRLQQGKKMPFVTYAERYGMEKGLLQGLLAGLMANTPGLGGKPIEAVENACASGGQAVLSVIQKLQLGLGDTGIALGYEKMRDAESAPWPRRTAATTPTGMEITVPMMVAAMVSSIVYGRFSATSCATEKLFTKEWPAFKVTVSTRKWMYCCQRGRFRPIFSRNSSSLNETAG